MLNKGTRVRKGVTVKHNTQTKRVLVAVTLAIVGLVAVVMVQGYTHQEKQRQQLQNTLQEKVRLQQELEKKQLDSQENQKQIEQLKKELQAKRDGQARALAASVRPVQARVAVSNPQCESWMAQAGIPISAASMRLIINESGCRYNAINPSSGACGIPQAYPCSKLPCSLDAAGAVCQLRWMQSYVTARYGTWENALATWQSRSPHWY